MKKFTWKLGKEEKAELKDSLLALYIDENLTQKEVAERLGLSVSLIRYYLSKCRIIKPRNQIRQKAAIRKKYSDAAKRRLSDPTKHPRFNDKIDSQYIADLYSAGQSQKSIALKLGVDPSVISLRLKMLNVPPPPKAKWNEAQTSFLKSNWTLMPTRKIAQALNLTPVAVYKKSRALHLKRDKTQKHALSLTGKFVHCAYCGKLIYRQKNQIRPANFCCHPCQGKILRPSRNQIRNALRANKQKPNKPELLLDSLLQEHFPTQFVYNGDLSRGVILGNLVPDFINVNGQKMVIELFGDYWHGDKRTARHWKATEFGRKAVFSQLGFKCVVIWEHELSNVEAVIQKIKEAF
ncbi:MAG: winged helix-turn-helix transcriptional regulator [Halobacteriota archaeon]